MPVVPPAYPVLVLTLFGWIMFKRALGILAAIAICVWGDQLTKVWALSMLKPLDAHFYLNGLFQLVLVENHGVFLSLGKALPEGVKDSVLVGVIGVVLAGAILWLCFRPHLSFSMTVAGVLFIAGGIGNLIDRAFNHGGVVDFMYLQAGSLHTGVFNVADIYIMMAAILILISGLPRTSTSAGVNNQG